MKFSFLFQYLTYAYMFIILFKQLKCDHDKDNGIMRRKVEEEQQQEQEWYYMYEDELEAYYSDEEIPPEQDHHHQQQQQQQQLNRQSEKPILSDNVIVEVSQVPTNTTYKPFPNNQIHRNIVIGKPLVNELYINKTIESFGCTPERIYSKGLSEDELSNNSSQLFTTKSNNPTIQSMDENSKKRLSFQEIQQEKKKQSSEVKTKKEKIKQKFPLGASCEMLVCGSCKVIVEELSHKVVEASMNPDIDSIDKVIENSCESREFSMKYDDIVKNTCRDMTSKNIGYLDALIFFFEQHNSSWKSLSSSSILYENQRKVCLTVGACNNDTFEFNTKPKSIYQNNWNDECFVCQKFAQNIEERIHLSKHITESSILVLISKTCEYLNLSSQYNIICETLLKGKYLDDISWIAKVHEEAIRKNSTSEKRFADSLCEEIDFCEKYLDPEELEQLEAKEEMEIVFF